MYRTQQFYFFVLPLMAILISCNDNKKPNAMKDVKLKEDNITYTLPSGTDTSMMEGFITYDENITGKRPAVIVIHEWWGMNDYVKMRARELARLGYIAMAIDMYGAGKRADNPTDAQKLATPFYMNPNLAKPVFHAALNKLKEYPQTNASNIGAIGYCFGGAQVLNLARMGEDLKAVVSFHGNLNANALDKNLLKANILVCHGAIDPFVPQSEVDLFKKQMDSIGAKYTFKAYEGATHAFSNPNATLMGEKFKLPIRYNAIADSASWKDMKDFFHTNFK